MRQSTISCGSVLLLEVITHRRNLGAVNHTCCFLRRSTLPFGRTAVLRFGDFRQVTSVDCAADSSQIVSARFKCSLHYSLLKRLPLNDNMRLWSLRKDPHATPGSRQFPGYLHHLGAGKLQLKEKELIRSLALVKVIEDTNEMIKKSFPTYDSC